MGRWLERYRQAVKARADRPAGHPVVAPETPRGPKAAPMTSHVPPTRAHRETRSLPAPPVPHIRDIVEGVTAQHADGHPAADHLHAVPAGSVIVYRGEGGKLRDGIVRAVSQDSRTRRFVLVLANGREVAERRVVSVRRTNEHGEVVAAWVTREHGLDGQGVRYQAHRRMHHQRGFSS